VSIQGNRGAITIEISCTKYCVFVNGFDETMCYYVLLCVNMYQYVLLRRSKETGGQLQLRFNARNIVFLLMDLMILCVITYYYVLL